MAGSAIPRSQLLSVRSRNHGTPREDVLGQPSDLAETIRTASSLPAKEWAKLISERGFQMIPLNVMI